MASPFYGMGGGQLTPTQRILQNPNMVRYQNMYRTLCSSRNPTQAIQQMIGNNPQLNSLLQQGRNPESVFRELAKQKGIDPDAFIRALQGR